MANSILASVVTLALGFVFTTVVGGLWAARLQDRSWKKQNDARMREAESERAAAACQDITTLLDRRLYRMQRLLWAATGAPGQVDDDELEARRSDYVDVLTSWNESLNVNLSLVGSLFGDDARARLDGLYADFKHVERKLEGIVRTAKTGADTTQAGAELGAEFEGRSRGSLNDRVYEFGLLLMGRLREGEVGRYAPKKPNPPA